MDTFLAAYYGTDTAVKTAAANQEDLAKQASVELFMKLAHEQNIDLAKMPEVKVNELYAAWVKGASAPQAEPAATKTASEEHEEAEKKRKEMHEKAEKEHEEKKAWAQKVAEADFLGRVMAHSHVQELRKIAEASAAPAVKTAEEEAKEKHEKEEKEKHEKEHGKEEHKEEGKHHMPPAFMEHLKHGSATDRLGAERAWYLAKEAGIDADDAFRKVAAVLTLGLAKDSTKTASAPTADQAIGIRALELLETAGFPVTWDQPAK
jgi:hypothetical protein